MKWTFLYFYTTPDEELKLEEKLLKETVKKNIKWSRIPEASFEGVTIPSGFKTEYEGVEYYLREKGNVYELVGQKQNVRTHYNKDYFNPEKINTNSKDLDVMDLYDIVASGKLRPIKEAHVCGASGFGLSVFDRCPGCKGEYRQREVILRE
jgi:hypothetical protein